MRMRKLNPGHVGLLESVTLCVVVHELSLVKHHGAPERVVQSS